MKLKKGDKVTVIAGKSKGQTGIIVRALPRRDAVIIDGLNLVKKHQRPSAKARTGQIVERAMPIHASNVMIVDPKSGKPSRIRIGTDKSGKRVRVAVASGEQLK